METKKSSPVLLNAGTQNQTANRPGGNTQNQNSDLATAEHPERDEDMDEKSFDNDLEDEGDEDDSVENTNDAGEIEGEDENDETEEDADVNKK
jgi:hypothetical protein